MNTKASKYALTARRANRASRLRELNEQALKEERSFDLRRYRHGIYLTIKNLQNNGFKFARKLLKLAHKNNTQKAYHRFRRNAGKVKSQ